MGMGTLSMAFAACVFWAGVSATLNAETIDSGEGDRMFACSYLLAKRSVVMDGTPKPCEAMLSRSASMDSLPIVRSMQLYEKFTRDRYSTESLLEEFMTIPEASWVELASSPYFMKGLNSAIARSLAIRQAKNADVASQRDFVGRFYRRGLVPADHKALGISVESMAIFATWFMVTGDADSFIDALDRIKNLSENHSIESQAYYVIFSIVDMGSLKNGKAAFTRMQEHYGSLDWRPVVALNYAVTHAQSASSYYRQTQGLEDTQNSHYDLWPTAKAWIERDILAASPDAAVSVLMAEAQRNYNGRQYDKAGAIVSYVLKANDRGLLSSPGNSAYVQRAFSMGVDILVQAERYADLKPYLENPNPGSIF